MDEHPPSIREGMLEYITNDELAQYSNMERLYEKLGKYLAMEHDYIDSYSMENLLITYGVEGAFKMVFDTYDLVGESVGVLRPTCAMMHFLPKVFCTNIIELSGSAPNYEITVDDIMKIIPKIKVLFLDNPKCHMENHFNCDDVFDIIDRAEKYGVLVFLDEIYIGYGTQSFLEEGSYDITRFDNLIVSSSFSKSHMLPSLKFGWLLTDKKTKFELESTRYTYESSYPTSSIAEYVCDNPEYFEYFKESVITKRNRFLKQFRVLEQAMLSSHSASFSVFGGDTYNIRLYSENEQHVSRINNNFLDNNLVVGTYEDVNLYFSVPMNSEIEHAVYRSLEMGDGRL